MSFRAVMAEYETPPPVFDFRTVQHFASLCTDCVILAATLMYEGRTESHEQHFFACELGTADEGECGGRWNQLLYYP